MNKHMLAICTFIEGLRNLDKWNESELKTSLQRYRNNFSIHSDRHIELIKGLRKRYNYADPSGREITFFEWALAKESIESHVDESWFDNPGSEEAIHISTVWMGLNHAILQGMQIFETMIFGIEDDEDLKEYQDRYATVEEAELGHEAAVSLVSEYLKKKKKKKEKNDPT